MDFSNLLRLSDMSLPPKTIMSHFILTFVLSFIIFLVYKATYAGVAYSKSFNVSIILTSLVTAMVMMVIGNNLALSLGMVGALSIVRFRAAVKEPKDITYLFWGIAVGLSAGTGAYAIAILGTVVVAVVLMVFSTKLSESDIAFLLVIKGQFLDLPAITSQVKLLTKKNKLRMKSTGKDMTEIVYEIKINPNTEDEIIRKMQAVKGIEIINIVAYNGNINGQVKMS